MIVPVPVPSSRTRISLPPVLPLISPVISISPPPLLISKVPLVIFILLVILKLPPPRFTPTSASDLANVVPVPAEEAVIVTVPVPKLYRASRMLTVAVELLPISTWPLTPASVPLPI